MIELLVTSSVLIIILAAAGRLLRGRVRMRLLYPLWLLVALRLALPFSMPGSAVSVMNVTPTEAYNYLETAVSERAVADIENRAKGSAQAAGAPQKKPFDATEAQRPVIAADADGALMALWAGGAALTAARFIVVNTVFQIGLKRDRRRIEAGCALPVYVLRSARAPFLCGVFKPAIYVDEASAADARRMRHIIAHELGHFAQRDNIWAAVRALLLAAYWFDPLVWLAAEFSRRDGELACDEAAVAKLGEGERLAYGRTLVSLAEDKLAAQGFVCASAMGGGRGVMRERIRMIAEGGKRWSAAVAAVLLLAAFAVGCTFTGAESKAEQEPPPASEPADVSEAGEISEPAVLEMEMSGIVQLGERAPMDDCIRHFLQYTVAKNGAGECYAAAWKELDRVEEEGVTTLFLWVMEGWYGVEGDTLTMEDGSSLPVKIRLKGSAEEGYTVSGGTWFETMEGYLDNTDSIFTAAAAAAAQDVEGIQEELLPQLEAQGRAYLESMGRNDLTVYWPGAEEAPDVVFEMRQGELLCPLAGVYVSEAFGAGGAAQHKGIDYSGAEAGAKIIAAADGTVLTAEFSGAYGYCVILDHGDGLQTLYAHCRELFVTAGQAVKAGDVIATVGSTGNATGTYLHFEVRVDEEPVDPEGYLAQN